MSDEPPHKKSRVSSVSPNLQVAGKSPASWPPSYHQKQPSADTAVSEEDIEGVRQHFSAPLPPVAAASREENAECGDEHESGGYHQVPLVQIAGYLVLQPPVAKLAFTLSSSSRSLVQRRTSKEAETAVADAPPPLFSLRNLSKPGKEQDDHAPYTGQETSASSSDGSISPMHLDPQEPAGRKRKRDEQPAENERSAHPDNLPSTINSRLKLMPRAQCIRNRAAHARTRRPYAPEGILSTAQVVQNLGGRRISDISFAHPEREPGGFEVEVPYEATNEADVIHYKGTRLPDKRRYPRAKRNGDVEFTRTMR